LSMIGLSGGNGLWQWRRRGQLGCQIRAHGGVGIGTAIRLRNGTLVLHCPTQTASALSGCGCRRFCLVGGAGRDRLATAPALPAQTLQRQHRLLSMVGLSVGNDLWAVAKARAAGMPNLSTQRCRHRHCRHAAEWHAGPLSPQPGRLHISA
jgi:hypothetical protein